MIIAVAIRTEQDTYELPEPARHHDLIRELTYMGHSYPSDGEQGFIDDQQGFVTREEAARIVLNQKQKTRRRVGVRLSSIDLW